MSDLMTAIGDYLRDVADALSRLIAVTIAAAVVNCGLIYGGWYAWEVFTHTYSGETFKALHPERTQLIEEFFSILPYWQTALELAVAATVFTFVVGMVCQFIYLRHLLYSSLWGPLKLIWAVGLAFALAWLLWRYDTSLSSYYAYVIIIMPAMLVVLFGCMTAAQRVMPDIGTLVLAIIARF